jgi:adenosine deaminase
MPKIELHSHLFGCIKPETFMELADKKNISIDHLDFYNVDITMSFEIFKIVN